jgi:outer membrane murein-binding lipoprotein Lpp
VSKWTTLFGASVLAVGMLAGCSSDNGGTQDLTQADKTALTNALANTDFGPLAAYVVQVVGKVGTLDASTVNAAFHTAIDRALSLNVAGTQASAYEGAVGIAIQFDLNAQGLAETGWFYGVFGWNGINTSTNTVDNWVIVGGTGTEGSLPSSASGTVENGDVFAEYASGTTYYLAEADVPGTSGTATVSASSFSGSTDCSASQSGITVDCSYATGTMNGNFQFTAMSAAQATYTQSAVTFTSLPAVRMTISVTQAQ